MLYIKYNFPIRNLIMKIINIYEIILAILCFSLVVNCEDLQRQFKINLKDDLRTQLEPIIKSRKEALIAFINKIRTVSPKQVIQLINSQYENIKKVQPKEFIERVSVIAQLADLDEKDIFLVNVVYEVFCTTVIVDSGVVSAATEANEIFMGRNLDFGFEDFLIKLAFEGQFYIDGVLQFKAQGIAGYVGILNGVKVGKFALSLNQRNNEKSIERSFKAFLKGSLTPAYLLLETIEYAHSYSDAVERIAHQKITSPGYFSVSGIKKNEGLIAVKSYDILLEKDILDVDSGKWFLVQTNDDRAVHDDRRMKGEENLTKLKASQNQITYENVMNNVMIEYPTKNKETIYSTIQSPLNDGYLFSNYWEK